MSVKFDEFLQEQLLDSEFKNEYEALQPERAIIQAIIDARQRSGLTLERGNANPSLRTLQRLATGMGMSLHIEFRPIAGTNHIIAEKP